MSTAAVIRREGPHRRGGLPGCRRALQVILLTGVTLHAHAATAQTLARFADPGAWQVLASDDVHAALRVTGNGQGGKALCLDYRFPPGVAGFAAMRRPLPLDFPAHYALELGLRGNGPGNALQVKFIDASGWNVWWYQQPLFAPPAQWTTLKIPQREVGFAWGPGKDHTLKHTATLELTVSAVHGGSGAVCFDRFTLARMPAPPAHWPMPRLSASSALSGAPAAAALATQPAHGWRSDPAAGKQQTLTLDLDVTRRLGGLSLHWLDGRRASRIAVEASDDGHTWHPLKAMVLRAGALGLIGLPGDPSTRWLRLDLQDGPAPGYALDRLELQPPGWGQPDALLQTLARHSSRGEYPRALSGEQNDWTVLGVDGGGQTALFSSDGRLEPFKGGWSVEPMLLGAAGLVDWADVEPAQSLRAGWLPVPSVVWREGPLELDITAFGAGTPQQARLLARYTVRNHSDRAARVRLALLVRPFQVNPPTQFLNSPGGFGPIRNLRWQHGVLHVNGGQTLVTLCAPSAFVAGNLAEQSLPSLLAAWQPPLRGSFEDAEGLAQGALLYTLQLPPHGERSVGIAIPWTGTAPPPLSGAAAATHLLQEAEDATAAAWQTRLDRVQVQLPPVARHFQNTLYSALAQILLDRDGPALQPGTRSYARSWIRDGAMMSEALLRMGDDAAVRDYLLWYAPHQFSTGKVPCCVDWKGADPTPENDSQGELIFAIAEYTRYTHDVSLARQLWPHVEAAVRYMNQLRATQMTPAYRQGERTLFHGLMPRSISHEGYSAKPMHSYWDDFWSLRGYRDAAWLARQLDHAEQAAAYTRDGDDFQRDFFASIAASARWHHIDYIAGSADLGDFDPTSTTIALSPVGVQHALPQGLLRNTFQRYWRQFEARADGREPWQNYTPYEWRNVDAFVRLGWRERIPALLAFFLAGQRPLAWNQWAEVVWRDADAPHFIGDMPHGWVASDFLRSALDMLAYQRHRDHALVLVAGVPPAWMDDGGIRIENLRTPWGPLSYRLWRAADGRVHLEIPAGSALPPGGLVLTWPYTFVPGLTRVNGVPARWRDGVLRIAQVPANVEIETKGEADAGIRLRAGTAPPGRPRPAGRHRDP